ncbi:MAG: hypothetical protein GF308_14380 [Candidatus Heimdallarchaeota archaeon]|nr:hypothetical protein [Candidatus Heimdallarchaeota archaeon]
MFQHFFQFRMKKQIKEKMIQYSFLPCKYLEALHTECLTTISADKVTIWGLEAERLQEELGRLLGKGRVNTDVKVEKYKLFERINYVLKRIRVFHQYLIDYAVQLPEANYKLFVGLVEAVSYVARLFFQGMTAFYEEYDQALMELDQLENQYEETIEKINDFKYPTSNSQKKWDPTAPKEILGTSLRDIVQAILLAGEKVSHMINAFNY